MRIDRALIKKVKYMLTHYLPARENDMYLAAMIWRYERGESFGKATEYVFLGDLANQKGLSHFTAIELARRKLQDEIPSLRGRRYELRVSSEKAVRKAIKSTTTDEIIKQGSLFAK